jgi:ketosteroid isomerase-like protein
VRTPDAHEGRVLPSADPARDTARAMPQENIELVRHGVAAWSRGDLDGFISLFDPECEVVFRHDVPEPGPFRGRTELRQWAEGFLSAWETDESEVVRAEAAGDHVFVLIRMVGRSAGSNIGTDDTWPFVGTAAGWGSSSGCRTIK